LHFTGESDGGEGENTDGEKMMERFLKWPFMSESEEELIKPFSEADMKIREGIARLIVACALLWVSVLYAAFVILVAIDGV